ncbi:MAG: altronate dehydratase family protein [Mariniblastus sp.]|nr:altronate dehydratase family protein [Mariniblastus sp.]
MRQTVTLNLNDNVTVALAELPAGTEIDGVQLVETIPAGHKYAQVDIAAGQDVIKYGLPIGHAVKDIQAGQHVHVQNLATSLVQGEFPAWQSPTEVETKDEAATFQGYVRPSGQVAIRNEIWIVNTVACVNQTASRLAERANATLLDSLENVDGFYAFPHPYGCSQLGDDLSATQQILAGLINHPHAAAVLILGLGCENNRMESQLKSVQSDKLDHVVFFNTQQVEDEMEEGMSALQDLAERANRQTRTRVGADQLVLAMKCGGSDGLSGITANPLLGRLADRHCRSGGTVLLTEVPEMFGAETLLLSRCATAEIHQQTGQMVNEFKEYFRAHQQPISENPSPGNRDGGITTLEEKSLGCVQKGGVEALVRQVVPYGGMAQAGLGGISLVNGPGNDGVSTTALTCAGAHIVLFTTGRGTPLGGPVPTLKISTQSDLQQRKPGWIDFDAGRLISQTVDMEKLTDELYDLVLRVSSGEQAARNELNGYREIAIWKTGVTL